MTSRSAIAPKVGIRIRRMEWAGRMVLDWTDERMLTAKAPVGAHTGEDTGVNNGSNPHNHCGNLWLTNSKGMWWVRAAPTAAAGACGTSVAGPAIGGGYDATAKVRAWLDRRDSRSAWVCQLSCRPFACHGPVPGAARGPSLVSRGRGRCRQDRDRQGPGTDPRPPPD